MPDLVTISDVELCREGVYELMTGPVDFNRARLTSAVENSTKGGPAPRVKIAFDEVHAAQANMPSLGNVAGLRLVEDGDTLTVRGDLVGVPKALADILPSAYASRSIEATAKGDDMTISALELLGVTAPGVHDIEDLVALYDGSAEFAIAAASPVQVEDADGETFTVVLASGLNVDDVRRAYMDRQREIAGPLQDPYDWWVDEVHIQPNELIVRNGASIYRVPWSVDGDGAFTFGDAVEVVVQYVDKVAASSGGPVVAYRAEGSRPKNDTQEESPVDTKKLRADIGLAEDASDEDVTAKIAELAARDPKDAVDTKVEEAVAAAKAEKDAEKAEAIAAAGLRDGFVPINKELLDDMQARFAKQDKDDAVQILASVTAERAITPAQRDQFIAEIESKPEHRERILDFVQSLPKGIVAGSEIGGDAPEAIAASAGESALMAATAARLGLTVPQEA